jgi:acyl-CoA reductase-like NAD-dependent aldehyde dehydrogenase
MDFKLLINGRLVDGDHELEVINPDSDPEDALARANASPWGLGGSIWSKDLDTARGLASRMNAGTVWINRHLDFGPTVPFGGAKQSGMGVEFAEDGLHEFTQLYLINEAK